MKVVDFKLDSKIIQVETRKIRAKWTPDVVQEILEINHDIDVSINEVLVDWLVQTMKTNEIETYNNLVNDWLKNEI